MSRSVDEVVIHCCNEVEQLLLEHLDSVHQLTQHHLVLQVEALSRAHVIDLVLIVFGVRVTLGVLLQQVWLLKVEISLLHQILRILDMNEQLKDPVVLSMNGLLIDDDLYWPLAVVPDAD